jgi:hypothetical protein
MRFELKSGLENVFSSSSFFNVREEENWIKDEFDFGSISTLAL